MISQQRGCNVIELSLESKPKRIRLPLPPQKSIFCLFTRNQYKEKIRCESVKRQFIDKMWKEVSNRCTQSVIALECFLHHRENFAVVI